MTDLTRDALAAALAEAATYADEPPCARSEFTWAMRADGDWYSSDGLAELLLAETPAGQALAEVVEAAEAVVAPEARGHQLARTERIARALDKLREAAR